VLEVSVNMEGRNQAAGTGFNDLTGASRTEIGVNDATAGCGIGFNE